MVRSLPLKPIACRLVEVPYAEAPGQLAPDLEALAAAARAQGARMGYLASPVTPGGHLGQLIHQLFGKAERLIHILLFICLEQGPFLLFSKFLYQNYISKHACNIQGIFALEFISAI